MKKYVLTISEKFPKSHPKSGDPTEFINKLKKGIKIHTIRANYELWEKRFKKIVAGEACLSVRVWEGKPYRSKQREVFCFMDGDFIGIEKLEFDNGHFNAMLVNGEYWFPDIEKRIATNDGLAFDDFENWFKGYDFTKPMAIIHFTDFRYQNKEI